MYSTYSESFATPVNEKALCSLKACKILFDPRCVFHGRIVNLRFESMLTKVTQKVIKLLGLA